MDFGRNWKAAAQQVKKNKEAGKTIVSTNGCFDILHPGHAHYLQQAKNEGEFLIVAINSDNSVKKIKGPKRQVQNESARATMLMALKPVDAVCIFDEDTPIAWLEAICPDIHVKGGDYVIEKMPEYETLKKMGAEIKCLDFLEGHSSTKLIQKANGENDQ